MKAQKTIYWIATGLFSALMLMSATMYVVQHDMVAEMFKSLGHPVHIIYPLALAKLLGVIAILTKRSQTLKEWAYAGFFFELLLAVGAHIAVGDGGAGGAIMGLALILTSYFMEKKAFSGAVETKLQMQGA